MSHFVVNPGAGLSGRLRVPGDKSISHRALLFGALADGETNVRGFLAGADCLATLAALQAMGIAIERPAATEVRVQGRGLHGLRPPAVPLDMGNSGTAMRLLAGVLAGQPFDSELVGDASLSARPMERVAEPLRRMGARIETQAGRPPLRIHGGAALHGIDYAMPVASAQVKSAVLLAGLFAAGDTQVTEPAVTRDHTERMLAQFGVNVRRSGAAVGVSGGARLAGTAVAVPGDLSSAAFFLVGSAALPGSAITIDDVGLNPTRTGVLRILELMGADIDVIETGRDEAEPRGQLVVRGTRLHGITVPPELVPLAIDEFPALFAAAALADGVTTISGAAELRHKESDRIGVMSTALRALGIQVTEREDGAVIHGGRPDGGTVHSHGDHRVAMSLAMLAAAARGPVTITDTANVGTSFPGFAGQARKAGLDIRELVDA